VGPLVYYVYWTTKFGNTAKVLFIKITDIIFQYKISRKKIQIQQERIMMGSLYG